MARHEIGKICYKGPHAHFDGESDYGSCASHYYATIYVVVEEDHANPRGEDYSTARVAERVQEAFRAHEAHVWCECGDEGEGD